MNNDRREGSRCYYRWRETGDEIEGEFVNGYPTKGKIFLAEGG